jgi:hypothetical protein
MTIVRAMVRDRRIEVPAPNDVPDGTEVTLTIAEIGDGPRLPQPEIVRILAAMQKLDPWTIPPDVAADLDDWEQKINQRGLEYRDASVEDAL